MIARQPLAQINVELGMAVAVTEPDVAQRAQHPVDSEDGVATFMQGNSPAERAVGGRAGGQPRDDVAGPNRLTCRPGMAAGGPNGPIDHRRGLTDGGCDDLRKLGVAHLCAELPLQNGSQARAPRNPDFDNRVKSPRTGDRGIERRKVIAGADDQHTLRPCGDVDLLEEAGYRHPPISRPLPIPGRAGPDGVDLIDEKDNLDTVPKKRFEAEVIARQNAEEKRDAFELELQETKVALAEKTALAEAQAQRIIGLEAELAALSERNVALEADVARQKDLNEIQRIEISRLQQEVAELKRRLAELEASMRDPLEAYLAQVAEARKRLLEQLRDSLRIDFPDLTVVLSEQSDALQFQGEGLFLEGQSTFVSVSKRDIVRQIPFERVRAKSVMSRGRSSSHGISLMANSSRILRSTWALVRPISPPVDFR